MNLEQELKAPQALSDGMQGGAVDGTLRLALANEDPEHAEGEVRSASSIGRIFGEITDASFKPWLAQLKSLLDRHQGDVLYIGRAGDLVHTELEAAERDVRVLDPFDESPGLEEVASTYGVIVVPGLAFAAWGRNRRKEDFQALVSDHLADGGLIVTDFPDPSLWKGSGVTADGAGNGNGDLAGMVTITRDPEGNLDVLDPSGEPSGASASPADGWETVDVKAGEVGDLERLLVSAGLVETYRTPSASDGSVARMYAFKRQNRAPLCHPFSPLTVSGSPGRVLVLTEGEGCKVRDAEGKEYVDACGGLWNLHLGLGNTEVIDAITAQLKKLSFGTLFAERGNQPALDLATKLIELAPYPMQWVCLTGSGSESTEVAMRVASYYHVLAGRKDQKRIAYLDESYHGSFAASTCVSGLNPFRRLAEGAVPSFALPTPNPAKCPEGVDYETFAVQCADALEEEAKAGDVAAFIVEPILGSAGVLIPPKVYFDRIRAICDRYEIVLIADEVATGFGRTGRWFACEHFELRPDIVTVAKGINSGYAPLGAVLFSAAIGEQFNARGVPLPHGSTYNGHPMCCASAIANLNVIERDGLVERSAEMGELLMDALGELSDLECTKEVRGLGLMCSVVLQQADGTPPAPLQVYDLYKRLQAAGVLVYPAPAGFSVTPALIVSPEEIALIASRIKDVVASVRLSDGAVTPLPGE